MVQRHRKILKALPRAKPQSVRGPSLTVLPHLGLTDSALGQLALMPWLQFPRLNVQAKSLAFQDRSAGTADTRTPHAAARFKPQRKRMLCGQSGAWLGALSIICLPYWD